MNIPNWMTAFVSWSILGLGFLAAVYFVLRVVDLFITAILHRLGLFRDVVQFMLWKRGADGFGPPPRAPKKKPQEDEVA